MSELTPEEVRDVVFDHAPVFHRGYDETQVDEFLDRVETTLVSMQRALLEQQLQLNGQSPRSTDGRGSQPATGQEHRAIADQVITDARRRADEIVENARTAAQRAVEEARAEAFRLVANASRQIVGAGAGGRLPNERERELAAAAAEVADHIAHIRDALSGEVAHLYEIAEQLDIDSG
jgi:DivIVA domain-containing protein